MYFLPSQHTTIPTIWISVCLLVATTTLGDKPTKQSPYHCTESYSTVSPSSHPLSYLSSNTVMSYPSSHPMTPIHTQATQASFLTSRSIDTENVLRPLPDPHRKLGQHSLQPTHTTRRRPLSPCLPSRSNKSMGQRKPQIHAYSTAASIVCDTYCHRLGGIVRG